MFVSTHSFNNFDIKLDDNNREVECLNITKQNHDFEKPMDKQHYLVLEKRLKSVEQPV